MADVLVVWARDVADGAVKGFLVERGAPGLTVATIEGKIALRIVQNGALTFRDVVVPEHARLAGAHSFEDTARVLTRTRAGVAWMAVGCAMGAYEKAVAYAQERKQFGRPIGGFQLVQAKLAEMTGLLVQMQATVLQVSRLQDAGRLRDEHAALAKLVCAQGCRRIVALARETLGGNGILLEHVVARHFADAEALYTYEGTHDVQTLILGRALTGQSAFV
jgi:glutaryl-CoA dehydrogenase